MNRLIEAKRRLAFILLIVGPQFSCGPDSSDRTYSEKAVGSQSELVPGNSSTRLVMLGTGTPNADPQRSGPAAAVIVHDEPYLVDCGPGIVRRAAAADALGIHALAVSKLNRVFITHLHSDHTLGLPDLIFSPWVLERTEPLEIFGPPGIRDMVEHIQHAWAEDVRVRLEGLEPANSTGFHTIVHEIEPGLVYRDDNISVTAIEVRHGSCPHAYGFRFDSADRSIVFSGDTAACDALISAAQGCDILVHEVYSVAGFATRPREWQAYHSQFHTSASELAQIAAKIRPRLLVLTHQLFWGASEADLLEEVRNGYSGRVVSAHDLDCF